MRVSHLPFGLFRMLLVLIAVMSAVAQAAEAPQPAEPAKAQPAATDGQPTAEPGKEVPLGVSQQALGNRFERFQTTLLQMAEQMRKTDPDRAELLFRALGKSQEERVVSQMRMIEQLLSKEDRALGDVVKRQEALQKALLVLLDLLQSENRMDEIEAERKRVEALLKDVNKLIGKEKDVRAATERGASPDRAAEQQKNVSDETQATVDKIAAQDAKKRAEEDAKNGKPSGAKPNEDGKTPNGEQKPSGKSGDPSGDKKDDPSKPDPNKSRIQKKDMNEQQDGSDPKSPDSQKPEGTPQQGKPQQGKPQQGQPQQGQPQQGQPQEGQPQEGQQQDQQQTPGKQELEEARQEMQKAIENLKKQDRNQASRSQDEALKRLLQAKEKFEEILRQLREEEKKLTLTALEARFRKMLALQLLVYNDTVLLAKNSKMDDIKDRARQLSRNEDAIVQEVQKALVLLKEEGSSVAFPEATEAIRDDMQSIVARLDQANVGELTQTIEQNVIEALEEMIDALQKEIEKSKDKDQQKDQQQQQQQEPGDDPLVDALSELKMLRSLQLRINRTTKKLGRLIEGEQSQEPEVLDQLRTLSRRQAKIQQATYDLAIGRNK